MAGSAAGGGPAKRTGVSTGEGRRRAGKRTDARTLRRIRGGAAGSGRQYPADRNRSIGTAVSKGSDIAASSGVNGSASRIHGISYLTIQSNAL